MKRPYDSKQWRDLRVRVLERDGYVCRLCGGKADAVDHIISWREAPMLAFSDEHCRAVCTACNTRRANRSQRARVGERRPSREW